MKLNLKDLAIQTVTAPRQAAAQLLCLSLRKEALWTLLALVAIVNTIFYSLSISLFESSTGVATGMNLPILYLALLSAAMVIGSMVLRWIGLIFGGKATLQEVMILVIWMQAMRALVQAGLLVLMMLAPGLANFVALAVGLYGLWIMTNFMDVAQGWEPLANASCYWS